MGKIELKYAPVGASVRWEDELFTVMGPDVPDRNGLTGHKWGRGKVDWISDCAEIELVNEGPVREVTRREIVPGNYGKVRVTEGRYVHCKSMSTAEELREAAHILNQIAEALE